MLNRFTILLILIIGVNKSDDDCSIVCSESAHEMEGTCTIRNFNVVNFILTSEYEKDIITQLIFINSTIFDVPANFTKGFHNLTSLDMTNCSINYLSKKVFFYSAINLQSLNISHNNISELSESQFKGANNLNNLDLSYNVIKKIDSGAFKYLANLKVIDLSYNEIESLDNEVFALKTLEIISLNNNKLHILQFNAQCQTLYVDNNLLVSDNVTITNMESLKYFTLRNNSLTHLQFLENSKNLTQVVLSNNQFDTVQFTEIPENVEILDISNNNLKTIEFNSLSHLYRLKHLNISGNQLGNQNFSEIMNMCPNLTVVEITDNDWMCDRLNETLTIFNHAKIKARVDEWKTILNGSNIYGIGCKENKSSNSQKNDTDNDGRFFSIFIYIIICIPYALLIYIFGITIYRENYRNGLRVDFDHRIPDQ